MKSETLKYSFQKSIIIGKRKSYLFLFLLFFSCKNENDIAVESKKHYLSSVNLYLQYALETERDSYDACHFLMIPLHGAFYLNNKESKNDFAQFFERFTNKGYVELATTRIDRRLDRLHFYYFVSRFLAIAKETKNENLIPSKLDEILLEQIESIWLKEPAWQWGVPDFRNMRERVVWKLDGSPKDVKIQYYRTITDEERFIIAIAADLMNYLKHSSRAIPTFISDIVSFGVKIMKERVVWTNDGGWLFQPGIWYQHPDFAYSGNAEVSADMKPLIKEDIAEDSSHFFRFPLWIISMIGAFDENTPEKELMKRLQKGLSKQFLDKVLVQPSIKLPFYLTNNFMDGYNGIYRWSYYTYTKGDGVGPYELSGSLHIGWWCFLPDKKIQDLYQSLANNFPISKISSRYYKDRTTRLRNPIINEMYTNGLLKFICLTSVEINKNLLDSK